MKSCEGTPNSTPSKLAYLRYGAVDARVSHKLASWIGGAVVLAASIFGGVEPSHAFGRKAAVCPAKVAVSYQDKGFKVSHQRHVQEAYRQLGERDWEGTLAYTDQEEIYVDLGVEGEGCSRVVTVDWVWPKPIKVVLPPEAVIGACMYSELLAHEKHHVEVFLQTPRRYENKIKKVLSKAYNVDADLQVLMDEIKNDIMRKNDAFDMKDSHLLPRRCDGRS